MSWKKHFRTVKTNVSPINGGSSKSDPGYKNYQSTLPEVYIGHPNRIDRYNQYEQMDLDSEINASLDILSEFCSQRNVENKTAFDISFINTPTENETKILKEQLLQWVKLNELDRRAFKLVRNVLKYGDQVFIRDPETFELYWVEMMNVSKVIVNESHGKEPEQYVVKDISPNLSNLSATMKSTSDVYSNQPQTGGNPTQQQGNPYAGGTRFTNSTNETAVEAANVVHLSLTEGLDPNWPFGVSTLEQIFKVYKQKELLEDAILIYRIQRAPERRVFKIDVGNMPSHLAMAFVERVKNEIHQRRIPTESGGGTTMMDATYNPLSTNEDYFFPQTADGRGSDVTRLEGGSNLGEIDDLRYFNNKMFRGLRIPASYLPTDNSDSASYNDGRVGTALIQEWRFNQYCMRLQGMISKTLDKEFKMFMNWRGINIDSSLFELKFNEPQNFASYTQADIDSARMATFAQIAEVPYISKRFALKRYMGMTEEEMQENDELWRMEQGETAEDDGDSSMRSVGISPGGMEGDIESFDDLEDEFAGDDLEGGETDSVVPDAGGAASEPELEI